MKRSLKRLLFGAGAAAGVATLLSRWPVINDVETGRTPEYPDIQPRRYALSPDRVFLAAQEVGHETSGWKLGDIDPQTRTYHAEASVALTPFVDDVWVTVQPDEESMGETGSIVDVHSKSRKGKGDFGVNARRIQTFLDALDRKLGQSGARS